MHLKCLCLLQLLLKVKKFVFKLLIKKKKFKVSGKEAMAVEAFARALSKLPTIICDNAGFDSAEIVTRIRAEHAKGNHQYGIGNFFII